ncbi:MAG: polyphosphate kinase 2 [Methylobacteriaceae bacterium]|nr:polyphosphate kinase 2 [Methylobacteriaceae bacterium]
MKTSGRGPRKGGKGAGKAKAAAPAASAFDMKAPLPKRIEQAAFASGGFLHKEKMDGARYEEELRRLQIELQKAMSWVRETGARVAVVFEGRDAAGKGGAIKRLTEHLNPRYARIVALTKPTETEAGQWYFQRYVAHMPTRGEMAIFDRSWYNRAGVEPVFGFCTPEQTEQFLREAPEFERMLTRDGVRIIKFFLTVGREMQMKRLSERWGDPLARWKISPIDSQAVDKWDAYSQAFDRMLATTDSSAAPWTVLRANDKKRTRLEVIRHILTVLPYAPHEEKKIGKADPLVTISAAEYVAKGGEE